MFEIVRHVKHLNGLRQQTFRLRRKPRGPFTNRGRQEIAKGNDMAAQVRDLLESSDSVPALLVTCEDAFLSDLKAGFGEVLDHQGRQYGNASRCKYAGPQDIGVGRAHAAMLFALTDPRLCGLFGVLGG